MNTIHPTSFIPRFSIHRADGTKQPGLERNFLIKMYVSNHDIKNGWIKLPDNTYWALTIEPGAKAAMVENGTAQCIVSFQLYDHGTYCVARFYNRNKPALDRLEPPPISWGRTGGRYA